MGQRELDDKHFSPLSAALTTAPATLVAGTLLAKVGPIQLCFLINKNDDVNQNKHTEVWVPEVCNQVRRGTERPG